MQRNVLKVKIMKTRKIVKTLSAKNKIDYKSEKNKNFCKKNKALMKKGVFSHIKKVICNIKTYIKNPWTQDVNWTYIRCSEDAQNVFWTSIVLSIYVLCLGEKIQKIRLFDSIFHTLKVPVFLFISIIWIQFKRENPD